MYRGLESRRNNIIQFVVSTLEFSRLWKWAVYWRNQLWNCRQLEQPQGSQFWTDFLKAKLEPKNVWQLPGCWEDSVDRNMSGYGSGRLHFSNTLQEDVIDKIRRFAEGCDLLQAGGLDLPLLIYLFTYSNSWLLTYLLTILFSPHYYFLLIYLLHLPDHD